MREESCFRARFTERWHVNTQRLMQCDTLPSDIFSRCLFQTYAHTFFSVYNLLGISNSPGRRVITVSRISVCSSGCQKMSSFLEPAFLRFQGTVPPLADTLSIFHWRNSAALQLIPPFSPGFSHLFEPHDLLAYLLEFSTIQFLYVKVFLAAYYTTFISFS